MTQILLMNFYEIVLRVGIETKNY